MERNDNTHGLDVPPAYASTDSTGHHTSVKTSDSQARTSGAPSSGSSRKGIVTRIEGIVKPTSLPDDFLHTTPPAVTYISEDTAYPRCVIRDGNIVVPEHDPTFILYYMAEATYSPQSSPTVSMTQIYKRGRAIDRNDRLYTVIKRPGQPERYTDMFSLYTVSTTGVMGWTISQGLVAHNLDMKLMTYRQAKEHQTMGLNISQSPISTPVGSSGPASTVKIKRLPVTYTSVGEKLVPYTYYQPYKWVDVATGNILAQESMRARGSSLEDSRDKQALRFSDSPPVGKQLRDIITTAWCISLWIDEWAQRNVRIERAKREAREQEKGARSGFLGKLLGGKSKKYEDRGDRASPVPDQGNPLREQLGLDAPNPDRGKDRLWYE